MKRIFSAFIPGACNGEGHHLRKRADFHLVPTVVRHCSIPLQVVTITLNVPELSYTRATFDSTTVSYVALRSCPNLCRTGHDWLFFRHNAEGEYTNETASVISI